MAYRRVADGARNALAMSGPEVLLPPSPAEDHDTVIARLSSALERARTEEDLTLVAPLLANLARQYFERGDFDRAIEYCEEALETVDEEANPRLYIMLQGRMASTYQNLGRYDRSIEYATRARELSRRHGLNQYEVNALLVLALTFHGSGDLEQSRRYTNEAIELFEETGDAVECATILLIGSCLGRVGEHRRAIEFFERGVHISHMIGNRSYEVGAILELSAQYDALGESAGDVPNDEDALRTFAEAGARWKVIPSLLARGEKLQAEGSLDEAVAAFEQGLELASETGARPLVSSLHRNLYEVLKQRGDIPSALEHLELHHAVRTEIFTVETQRRLHELRVRHELESARHIAEIAQLQAAQLQLRFAAKQGELTAALMSLARQTELLRGFRSELRTILRTGSNPVQIVRQFGEKLREDPSESIDWVRVEAEFQGSYPEFRDRLVERYPELTKMEVRICSLVKVRLTTPDISRLLNLSERTIENHRLNIRKKAGLQRGEELFDVLRAF